MGIFLAILLVLAIYRVTRLFTEDKIPLVAKPRDWLIGWLDPWPSEIKAGKRQPTGATAKAVAYLLTCPWCMSVWVGAGMIPLASLWVDVPYPWLLWPAASAITGLIATREGLAEKQYELLDARRRLVEAEIELTLVQTEQAKKGVVRHA